MTIRRALAASVLCLPLLAVPAAAQQDPTNRPAAPGSIMQGQMPGCMPGMMGPMMQSGQMGPGQMGPGMMGPGMMGPGGHRMARSHDFTPEEMRQVLEGRIAWHGATRLQVGEVTEEDGSLIAHIETVDGSLVHRLEIDPATGAVTSFD